MTFTAATLALAAILAVDAFAPRMAAAAEGAESGDTYGMRLYTNTRHGFSFWYPKGEPIGSAATILKAFPAATWSRRCRSARRVASSCAW
jgi:hypothetical protein